MRVVSGGMAYAAYLVPKLLNPETKQFVTLPPLMNSLPFCASALMNVNSGSDDQPKEKRGPRISRTNSGIRIENLGQMDADKGASTSLSLSPSLLSYLLRCVCVAGRQHHTTWSRAAGTWPAR